MISIQNLAYHPSKKKNLYQDFSLELNSGNIIGLLGKNGAGKSTLLNLISGLLSPEKGNIKVHNFNPKERNPNFLTNIFLVTDEPYTPDIKIKTYVKSFAPLYANFDLDKLNTILAEFELTDNMKLNKISYGQRKKFTIAFALAANTKLLLLDEPTNGLDIPSKKKFRKVLISSINEDQLVIISTHQVKDIDTIIDKILVIDDGKLIFEEDIFTITQKLQFQKVNSIQHNPNVLYSEKCPEGHHIITPIDTKENTDSETEIDIELLFNAISANTIIKL